VLQAPTDRLVYLSPEAPEALECLSEDEIYVIGGLVDRRQRLDGASLARARAIGARACRLPLVEMLSPEQRARSDSLDQLNVNSVFRIIVEYAACRSWPEALRIGLGSSQRGYTA